jgi:hypothetical protein
MTSSKTPKRRVESQQVDIKIEEVPPLKNDLFDDEDLVVNLGDIEYDNRIGSNKNIS